MAKDTFYFSHDYNPRQDPEVKKLLFKHGMLGYGIFWAIVEQLYNNTNVLPLEYDSIAYDLHCDLEVIKSVINDFGLFNLNCETFSSDSVGRRLNERNEKSIKAKQSIQKRWDKYERNTNVIPTKNEGNTIKEIKGKESKVNNPINNNTLLPKNEFSPDQNARYLQFLSWIERHTPAINKLPKPVTIKEFLILRGELPNSKKQILNISATEIAEILEKIENNKEYLKKYRSPYLCIIHWHKNNLNGVRPE